MARTFTRSRVVMRRAPAEGEPGEEATEDPLMAWLLERGGVRPAAYRPAVMRRRLPACLRQLRVPSASSARVLLERRPGLLALALNSVLIGVSDFFRDEGVFDFLETTVLPELLRTRAGLSVCAAGVSNGQELYSVAMLLAEAGALEDSALLGIDCRLDAVRRAREGRFGAAEMGRVGPGRRERFFHAADGCWQVASELRDRMRWRAEDVSGFVPDAPCDLILFRNVAIYFTGEQCASVWTRLCDGLAPGGFLVTGKAEKPSAHLPLTRVAPSVYRKNSVSS